MTARGARRLVFVKLGGSVITDKTQPEADRPEVIARLASEVARALAGAAGQQDHVGGCETFAWPVTRAEAEEAADA